VEYKDLRIDGKRLQTEIEASAEIGATPNKGLDRCAATEEDRIGRDLLMKW